MIPLETSTRMSKCPGGPWIRRICGIGDLKVHTLGILDVQCAPSRMLRFCCSPTSVGCLKPRHLKLLETANSQAASGLLASLAACSRGIQREELIRATTTLCSRNILSLAHQCMHEMEQSKMRPSLRAYNALLRAYASKRRFADSTQLLLKMRQASLTPDAESITSVVRSGLGLPGGARLAEHFLPELQRAQQHTHELPPSAEATYLPVRNVVIDAMSRDPLSSEGGLHQLQTMLARGDPLSAETFMSVLQGYAKQGGERWREAMQVLGMLEGWLSQGDKAGLGKKEKAHVSSSFAAAISACAKGGRADRAIETLERMDRLGLSLSVEVGRTSKDRCW